MKMKKIKIWTEAYSPWIMGGDVNAPISTELECTGPHKAGAFELYIAKNPITGQEHIVESETGAFIGTSLEGVRNDIETADKEIVKEQLIAAHERVKEALPLSNEDFWRYFRK